MASAVRDSPPISSAAKGSSTRWSLALRMGGLKGKEAFRELAGSYWYCVYAWWRRTGLDREEAAEATIACFTRWFDLAPASAADAGSGRMRTWLPPQLAQLVETGVEFEGPASMSIEPDWAELRYADEPAGTTDAIFHRRWAITLIEFTASQLRMEYTARGEEELFVELLGFAGFEATDDSHCQAVATRLGRTMGATHKAVYDFRLRQREVIRALVADTISDPAEADAEIGDLLCAYDAPGPESAMAPLPSAIRTLHPDEVLARAIRSVHMTGGGDSGRWRPPTVEEAARLFPQYEVRSLLGRGGMGAVYEARQVELDRLVAIKLLPLEVSVDVMFAERFRREARAMARLNHPNIIAVHDFGTTSEGHLYFVMEYVEGANLHEIIHGPGMTPAQALEIIGSVCDALHYAHSEGVVHRDMKPANVMVSKRGHVKVADFGLARLNDAAAEQLGHTVTGTVMGTPDYMAPEQKRGMNVDARADVYSLGVMLYEMLCREIPQGIFDPPSQRVGVDTRVDQVVIKAMQQQPERRYQNTQEMKADVTEASTPRPQQLVLARLPGGGMSRAMTIPTRGWMPGKPTKRRRYFVGLAVALVVFGVGGFFASKYTRPSAAEPIKPETVKAAPADPLSSESVSPMAITKAASFSPWQPLFTEAEWKQTVPGKREVVDGRLHLQQSTMTKPQAAADGSIRARIHSPEGAQLHASLVARVASKNEFYRLWTNGGNVSLEYFTPGADAAGRLPLGRFDRPTPLQPGATLLLELRLQGDRLTALVDGVVVLEARDSHFTAPGEWGITAANGWFESVEVQTPLPAAANISSSDGWENILAQLTPERLQRSGDGWLREGRALRSPNQPFARLPLGDFAARSYQVRVKLRQLSVQDGFAIMLPVGDRLVGFTLDGLPSNGYFTGLNTVEGKRGKDLPGSLLGQVIKDSQTHELEVTVRLDGEHASISSTLDARPLYAWTGLIAALNPNWPDLNKVAGTLALLSFADNWLVSEVKTKKLEQPATPATATKDAPFVNSIGMKFVPVPIAGGPAAGKTVLFSVWDTRVQDYEVFATETKRAMPRAGYEQGPMHPAAGVNWDDATAFCAWLTERERKAGRIGENERYRLPSDHEWSCAVGIGEQEDAARLPNEKNQKIADVFPWGTAWPPPDQAGNYWSEELRPLLAAGKYPWIKGELPGRRDGFAETSPVGSYAPNPFGLYDMGGNVWQWCGEWFDKAQKDRVLRGPSWERSSRGSLLSSNRLSSAPEIRGTAFGFRVVLAPQAETVSTASRSDATKQ